MKPALFLLACAFTVPVAAQEEAAPPAGEPPSSEAASTETADIPVIPVEPVAQASEDPAVPADPTKLDDIVVTATKRVENIRQIPASITSLSGEDLEMRGVQDTADIVKLVPGVNLTSTGDTPARVTIRGISADIATSSTTGILFGNASFAETYVPAVTLDPNPFDLASVEVLKGPQGTLYGASALNGAIRYVPEPPRFGENEVKWFGQYTTIKEGDAAPTYGAVINTPLFSDDLALRIVAFDRLQPGYVDNLQIEEADVNRTDQRGARALLGWEPGGAWDVLLTVAWQSTLVEDVSIVDDPEGKELSTNLRPRKSPNRARYALSDLTVTYAFDWAELVSDTSVVIKRAHNFFDASSRNTQQGEKATVAQAYYAISDTYSQEFRLVSPDEGASPWKWTAGVFGWLQDVQSALVVPYDTEAGTVRVLGSAADVQVKELALFGDVTRHLTEDLDVTLGGRLYQTESGGTNTLTGVTAVLLYGEDPHVIADGVKEKALNPKLSVLWHFTDDILTYGLVSKGFRVGGVQFGITTPASQRPAPRTFKSDTLWNYELGLRTQWLDNTLRADLTGFYVDWKDPQSLQLDASGVALYIDNVGGVSSTGADFALQYLSPWGVMLKAGASYAETVTTEDFKISSGAVVPAGSPWPLAPELQTFTNLSASQPLGNWVLGGSATWTTIGETIPFFTGKPIFDYEQLDLQVSLANPMIPWLPSVALTCNNVLDQRGRTNAFANHIPSPETDAEEYYYTTPRTFMLRLMGRFGW